jgi:hypothetical protein
MPTRQLRPFRKSILGCEPIHGSTSESRALSRNQACNSASNEGCLQRWRGPDAICATRV